MHILIAGGGPAGCGAALGAAGLGAKVTLIERYGFLGGMGTAGLVHPWMKYYAGDKQIIGGVFAGIVAELKKYNAFKDSKHYDIPHHCFDPEILKWVLQEKLTQAGVNLILHSYIIGVIQEGSKVTGLKIVSKSGVEYQKGDIIIDATGDADLAFWSGVPCEVGDDNGLTQPMTLHFRMAGVNEQEMLSREEMNAIYVRAKKTGLIHIPREDLLWFDTTRKGEIHFNTTRVVKVNGLNREDLTLAELEARRQVMELVGFIKAKLPGFAQAYLLTTAAQIGTRETRRIIGEYQLTQEDVLSARKFEDQIALCSYGIDIHNPVGEGTVFQTLTSGAYYGIPYRCLVPKGVESIIVGGRPISTTHEAFSATRIQPACYATGQAAGVAAALAVKFGVPLRKLEITKIQEALAGQGAIIE